MVILGGVRVKVLGYFGGLAQHSHQAARIRQRRPPGFAHIAQGFLGELWIFVNRGGGAVTHGNQHRQRVGHNIVHFPGNPGTFVSHRNLFGLLALQLQLPVAQRQLVHPVSSQLNDACQQHRHHHQQGDDQRHHAAGSQIFLRFQETRLDHHQNADPEQHNERDQQQHVRHDSAQGLTPSGVGFTSGLAGFLAFSHQPIVTQLVFPGSVTGLRPEKITP